MIEEIKGISKDLILFKQQAKNIYDGISGLQHNDMGIKIWLTKLKRLSLQSLDLSNEIDRQLNFLNNEYKNYSDRQKRNSERKLKK